MSVSVINDDCRTALSGISGINCCVTSPPYFNLRDYGHKDQIGAEETPESYIEQLRAVFSAVKSALNEDGTLWLNLGDSYRDKQLLGIPWRVAMALQADGWILRQDIVWAKPNPMPESIKDRCTRAHEYIFMFSKNEKYYYDAGAIAEPSIYFGLTGQDENGFKNPGRFNGKLAKADKQRGHERRHAGFNARWDAMTREEQCSKMRNKRSVWEIPTRPFPDAHFATFPPDLIEPCILAGSPSGGTVLDPFGGSGTTGLVADRLGRNAILIELNAEYAEMARARVKGDSPMFAEVL